MLLSEQQEFLRDTLRGFVDAQIVPFASEWDRNRTFPREAVEGLAALGAMGVAIPEQYGGAGLDQVSLAVTIEEVARGDASTSTVLSVQNSLVCAVLFKFGTETQKRELLVPLARGEKLGCFCLTEPAAGSDASGIATQAKRNGGDWVISGGKIFISTGREADIALIFAVTGKKDGKNTLTCFAVPTDTPGFQVARVENKLGQHASDTAELLFDGMRVPDGCRVGEVDRGYKIALANLEAGRIGIAAQATGIAQAALEAAQQFAAERKTFGKTIDQHQAVAFMLAEMATDVTAARQLTYHAAGLRDAGIPGLKEACMAKLFASEMAERVTSKAIQIHGGYGYSNDYPVERYYRDQRICQIYEGTSQIQKMVISRQLSDGK